MARLRWRAPVAADGAFADWIDALRGHSGVYLIRDARTREIVYIGESHTNRLFETMTRHLYVWNGRGSGPSYHPAVVEMAVIVAETPLGIITFAPAIGDDGHRKLVFTLGKLF